MLTASLPCLVLEHPILVGRHSPTVLPLAGSPVCQRLWHDTIPVQSHQELSVDLQFHNISGCCPLMTAYWAGSDAYIKLLSSPIRLLWSGSRTYHPFCGPYCWRWVEFSRRAAPCPLPRLLKIFLWPYSTSIQPLVAKRDKNTMSILVQVYLKTTRTTVQLQKRTTADFELFRLSILFMPEGDTTVLSIFINQNNELLLSCLYSWLHFDLTLLVLHNNHPRATECSVLLPNCSWRDFLGIHTLLKLVRLGIVSITHKSACALLNRPRMQLPPRLA